MNVRQWVFRGLSVLVEPLQNRLDLYIAFGDLCLMEIL